jgi:uncharacterized small protein (DUF1192 family)
MINDDPVAGHSADPITALIRQDLGPLSGNELTARIAVLEEEIQRTRSHMAAADGHKASAEALFRKG